MQKVTYSLLPILFLFVSIHLSAAAACDSLAIQPDRDSIEVCTGGDVVLSVPRGSDIAWSPAEDFNNPSAQTVVLTPSASQWYYVTGTVNDTVCTDSIYVSVADAVPMFSVQVSVSDTICPLDPVTVTFLSDAGIDEVSWNTTEGVEDPNSITGTLIEPLATTEYIVIALINGCTLSDTFTIDVVNFRFTQLSEDTIYLCLPDTGTIRYTVFPSGLNVIWSPLDTTIELVTQTLAKVFPTISASYTATVSFEECVLTSTTFVRVDSLPDTVLTAIPLMDPYCAGEMVTIFAERADPTKYPDITFQWSPMDGQIQDSTNTGNVFVILQDTTTFIRVMMNNACRDTSSITLNVIPQTFPLSVMDTALCEGDMFDVEIVDPTVTDVTWTPEQGVSDPHSSNPTITVQANPIPYTVQGMKDRCTVTGMLNVTINPQYNIPISPDTVFACPGDEITFNIDTAGLTNLHIEVNEGSLSCDGCPNPVVTFDGEQIEMTVTADENFQMNCGAGGSAIIALKPNEQASLLPIEVCDSTATQVNLEDFGDFTEPVMLRINNGTLSCDDCLDPIVFIPQTTTLFILSQSTSSTACFIETQVTLLVPQDEVATFSLDPPPSPGNDQKYGQGQIISISLITNADPQSMFDWSVNSTPISGSSSTITASLDEETNTIHVEWTNSFGCLQSKDTTITTKPPGYKIPKAFTPDNLETNTHFKVQIDGNLQIIEMLVFNRWGKVVYEGTSEEGWDGMSEGKRSPPEVYAYVIKLRDPAGRTILEKGDVTLIR